MKKVKKIFTTLLPLLLGVFLVIYAYNKFTPEQLDEMKNHLQQADWRYISLSGLFTIIALFSRAYRWKYPLNHMGYNPKGYNRLMTVSVAYLLNFTIPRSGEISRAVLLQKYEKVPFDKGFGSIISERLVDLACLLLMVGLVLLLQFQQLYSFLERLIPFEKLLVAGCLGMILMIGLVSLIYYSQHRFFVAIKQKAKGLVEGLLSLFKMPNRTPFLIHTLIIWGAYIATFYFGTKALDATADLSLGVILITFVVGSLAISFTNGGLGAFPLMIAEILLLYNIPETAGTTFGWILWTSQTVILIIAGGVSFLLLPLMNKNLSDAK
ncbi:MAG TPA: lysylphosphatidylglycerol synthase transmembrane domain-containing protein [Flavobacterium sp.]|nr:lysylphosphatidylglycerol synthase transmembrane domain-containing protein [Flavobacterium sp.]